MDHSTKYWKAVVFSIVTVLLILFKLQPNVTDPHYDYQTKIPKFKHYRRNLSGFNNKINLHPKRKNSASYCTSSWVGNEYDQLLKFRSRIFSISAPKINVNLNNTFDKYRNHKKREHFKTNSSTYLKYDWIVTHKHCKYSNIIIITIQETYKYKSTSGGSSFAILQSSAHTKDFCPIMDLFNGTYVARCNIHEKNTTIVGEVHYVNFAGFAYKNAPIKSQFVEFSENPMVIINSTRGKTKVRAHWKLNNSTWRWFDGAKLTPRVDRKNLEQCVKQYSKITFMGDSHVRSLFYYMMLYLNLLPKNLPYHSHKDTFISLNISFLWSPLLSQLIQRLKKKLSPSSIPKRNSNDKQNKQLFVFNAMHWNIFHNKTNNYLKEMPKLMDLLKKASKHKSIRFVSLTSVVGKPRSPEVHIMRALNMQMVHLMTSAGIEAFDISTMLSSVPNSSADGIHFLTVTPKTQRISGKFGPGMADAVIHYLCG